MAFKSVRVSDLSGTEGNDDDFLTVVVRNHPGLDEPVQFDALPQELSELKGLANLVMLEIRKGEEVRQVVTTVENFNELAEDMDTVLAGADGLRGRRKGFRPAQQPRD